MKTQSSSALQYSGYPLRVIEDNVSYPLQDAYLKVIKRDHAKSHSGLITNPKVNDPHTWDAEWFCNYE